VAGATAVVVVAGGGCTTTVLPGGAMTVVPGVVGVTIVVGDALGAGTTTGGLV
jgi:hypothetical protein